MNSQSRSNPQFPCPCCGYIVFHEPPDSDDICEICFWHDDALSLAEVTTAQGPNDVSLVEAQRNFRAFGAKEARLKDSARRPLPTDMRDPEWRTVDEMLNNPEATVDIPVSEWPRDRTGLYYWRDTYWLRGRVRQKP